MIKNMLFACLLYGKCIFTFGRENKLNAVSE